MFVEIGARILGAALLGVMGWWLGLVLGRPDGFEQFLPWGLVRLLAGGTIGAFVAPYVIVRPAKELTRRFAEIPGTTLLLGTFGLAVGLVLAALLSVPFSRLPGWAGAAAPAAIAVFLASLGAAVMVQREREFLSFLPESRRPTEPRRSAPDGQILLDTSAIIDGRIADISQAGFVRGTLVVPRFILDELRHIADSSDSMRRNRGRRGLEVLSRLRRDTQVPMQVLDVDVRNGNEVDGKLVKLAKDLHASIVTTDFNLNRVAELQGVRVLNVNELANALKPVVLPGEEMTVRVIQEGKEAGQGVGFLDDGTMVVVEGGRKHINTHLDVIITRALQTAAGRIIFAQPKPGQE